MGIFSGFLENNEKHHNLIAQDYALEFEHAEKCVDFVVEIIDHILNYNPLFDHFYGHAVRHINLSLRSLLELQWAELNLNLRQALEGSCVTAYAMLCTQEEVEEFLKSWGGSEKGNRALMNKVYKALSTHYPELNEKVRLQKEQINNNFSHVLAVPSFGNQAFHIKEQGKQKFMINLCDKADDFHIRSFLFCIAHSALTIVDLLLHANDVHPVFSRSKIKEFLALNAENQSIRAEMQKHPRMQQKKEE